MARSKACVCLGHVRLGLHDLALGLGDGGVRARERGVVLRQLGVERFLHEDRQHVALLHAVALVDLELEHAEALDLGSDEDLLARDERARHGDRLGKVGVGNLDDGDGGGAVSVVSLVPARLRASRMRSNATT